MIGPILSVIITLLFAFVQDETLADNLDLQQPEIHQETDKLAVIETIPPEPQTKISALSNLMNGVQFFFTRLKRSKYNYKMSNNKNALEPIQSRSVDKFNRGILLHLNMPDVEQYDSNDLVSKNIAAGDLPKPLADYADPIPEDVLADIVKRNSWDKNNSLYTITNKLSKYLKREYDGLAHVLDDNKLYYKYVYSLLHYFYEEFLRISLQETDINYNKTYDQALNNTKLNRVLSAVQFAAPARRNLDILKAVVGNDIGLIQRNCNEDSICYLKYIALILTEETEFCSNAAYHSIVFLHLLELEEKEDLVEVYNEVLEKVSQTGQVNLETLRSGLRNNTGVKSDKKRRSSNATPQLELQHPPFSPAASSVSQSMADPAAPNLTLVANTGVGKSNEAGLINLADNPYSGRKILLGIPRDPEFFKNTVGQHALVPQSESIPNPVVSVNMARLLLNLSNKRFTGQNISRVADSNLPLNQSLLQSAALSPLAQNPLAMNPVLLNSTVSNPTVAASPNRPASNSISPNSVVQNLMALIPVPLIPAYLNTVPQPERREIVVNVRKSRSVLGLQSGLSSSLKIGAPVSTNVSRLNVATPANLEVTLNPIKLNILERNGNYVLKQNPIKTLLEITRELRNANDSLPRPEQKEYLFEYVFLILEELRNRLQTVLKRRVSFYKLVNKLQKEGKLNCLAFDRDPSISV